MSQTYDRSPKSIPILGVAAGICNLTDTFLNSVFSSGPLTSLKRRRGWTSTGPSSMADQAGSNGADSLIIWHIPRWLIFSDIQVLTAIISWDLNYVIFYDCKNFALLIPASLKVFFFDWNVSIDTAKVLDQALHCLGQWMLSAFSDFKHHFMTVCNISLFFTMQGIQCERMCWVLSVITSVCLWLAPIVNEQASTQNIRVWRARKNYRW